jgi:hypothetical protein
VSVSKIDSFHDPLFHLLNSATLLELFPFLIMQSFSVVFQCPLVLISLIQPKLILVTLILQDIEPIAARFTPRSVSIHFDHFLKVIKSMLFYIDVHNYRDGLGSYLLMKVSSQLINHKLYVFIDLSRCGCILHISRS